MGRGKLKQVTRQLADDLAAGFTLPQALERQKGRVPPYYAALLAAGIRSGRIGDVLGTLTIYARSLGDFRAALVSATVYPLTILVLGLGMVVFVSAWVVPEYADVFEKFHLKLPMVTLLLIFISTHWLATMVIPAAVVIAIPLAVRWAFRGSAYGRVLWARFVYTLPVAGTLLRSARLAAFTDLLGILVDQSIPLSEALPLAALASSDPLLGWGAGPIEKNLQQGMPLGEALRKERLVPDLVVWMTRFGEKQGTLGKTLHHLAQMYRRQADVRAEFLRTVAPPLLILLVAGVMVVLLVFGLLAPMLRMMEFWGGGKL